jgi:hypothetical protein
MTKGIKAAIAATLVLILAAGGDYWYFHHKHAAEDAAAAQDEALAAHGAKHADYHSDPDDLVFLKSEHPMSLKDEKDLKGRTLWVSAGGQMDYYAFNGHVDYAHSQGVLLGAEKIVVKDAVEQVAPKTATFRIPGGDKHVLLVFTIPDDPKAAGKEYAVPVGNKQAGDYTLLTDQIFFYDDPHKLFAYWGPQIWQAIDEHKAILGMSERQMQMALGQVSTPHGDTIGERMVEFDDQGKPKMVTFENGKATKIVDEGAK